LIVVAIFIPGERQAKRQDRDLRTDIDGLLRGADDQGDVERDYGTDRELNIPLTNAFEAGLVDRQAVDADRHTSEAEQARIGSWWCRGSRRFPCWQAGLGAADRGARGISLTVPFRAAPPISDWAKDAAASASAQVQSVRILRVIACAENPQNKFA
jgi:hypothetical protein